MEPRGLRVGGNAAIKDILRTSSRTVDFSFKFRVYQGLRAKKDGYRKGLRA